MSENTLGCSYINHEVDLNPWVAFKLGDLTTFSNGKSRPETSENGKVPIYGGNGILGYTEESNSIGDEAIIIGRVGAYCGSVYFENQPVWVSDNAILCLANKEKILAKYLYYLFKHLDLNIYAEGSSHPLLTQTLLNSLIVIVPISMNEQETIAAILTSLDGKINLLYRQNQTLEALAETLFRQCFIVEVDEKWEEAPLDSIAHFLNGLACQKYPPGNPLERLPVIKIKELRKGFSDNSDQATSEVNSAYIVKNGDVLFSWSGSLEVVLWSHGEGVLNQHLFKVTSDKYPKWFYYLWLKMHLQDFRDIATDKATTMGHIQRKHLNEARVVLPDEKSFETLNIKFEPLIEKCIKNNSQIRTLETLRDILLPKLMSGEVRVKYDKDEVEKVI